MQQQSTLSQLKGQAAAAKGWGSFFNFFFGSLNPLLSALGLSTVDQKLAEANQGMSSKEIEGIINTMKKNYGDYTKPGWFEKRVAENEKNVMDSNFVNSPGLPEGSGGSVDGGGGSGSGGSGKDSKSGKESLLKDGYNIDFILCSKKKLPDLNPDIFKQKYKIDLKRSTVQVDKLHINTRDKPENIEASVKNALIKVAESDRA
jgi:hypothetical protein